jgi:hypothetical protein
MFGPKKEETTGEWRRLHNKELYDLSSSPNIIQVIKSRTVRCAGHVACMETGEVHTDFGWGDLTEREQLKDLGIDGRIY